MPSLSNPEQPPAFALQRLDKGDRLADVVLVPPEAETDDDSEPGAEGLSEASAES
jgi:DNA gyrase subunit A